MTNLSIESNTKSLERNFDIFPVVALGVPLSRQDQNWELEMEQNAKTKRRQRRSWSIQNWSQKALGTDLG